MYGCDWYYYSCYPEVYAIMLIRIADNQIVWSRSQPEGLNLLALSPDGQLALVENDYEVQLWRVADGTMLYEMDILVDCATFSPDGQLFALGRWDRTITLHQTSNGTLVRTMRVPSDRYAIQLHFSPNGSHLASLSSDNRVHIWDVSRGTVIRSFIPHNERTRHMLFYTNTQVLTLGEDVYTLFDSIRLWDAIDGRLVQQWAWMGYGANLVRFSPDGQTLGTVTNRYYWSIFVSWSAPEGAPRNWFYAVYGASNRSITSFEFVPGEPAIVTATDRLLQLWDVRSRSLRWSVQAHTDRLTDIALSPNGLRIATASYERVLKWWNAANGTLLNSFGGHLGGVTAIDLSVAGSLLVVAMFSIPGDVDGDGCVSDSDLLQVLFAFGQTGDSPADVDGNGVVDDGDLLIVLLRFGTGCE
jgi:WD40 repeat protein